MVVRKLILAPDPIFKSQSQPIDKVDESIKNLMHDLRDTMLDNAALGIAAPMIGIKKCVIVTNVQTSKQTAQNVIYLANPIITKKSLETQVIEEASLCFPAIFANITRPKNITVKYLDDKNNEQILEAEGLLSSVIQHEIDYLNGRVFLDYLSRTKRSLLLKKMQKFIKNSAKHHHHDNCGSSCSSDH